MVPKKRGEVRGTFKDPLVEIGGGHEPWLVETFVNCRADLADVFRFTRRYGPPLKIAPEPGSTFGFKFKDFRAMQEHFRKMWRNLKQEAAFPIELLAILGGTFRCSKGITTYEAPNLYAYLYADLLTNPSIERFRFCQRDEYRHAYFLAGHLRQQVCSDDCAEESQRRLKREWWQKHGQSWLGNKGGQSD